jgi:5-methylcytosine-specific restriction endonuclease McrBC GTP-binding regulatory subunit McrB
MELKKVTVQDGNYLCDIDVSVEEWKTILQDETLMLDTYKDALIKFYNEPEHKSTCKALGEKYPASDKIMSYSFTSRITNFAKAVQKKLNRFDIFDMDGNRTYWIIPMMGKYVDKGFFEWTIRPELVQAMEEIGMTKMNLLQKIYDDAIKEKHWVFSLWFPNYKRNVEEYKEQAINNSWTESVFQRLIKDTKENGISDLPQKNFEWNEFEKIKNHWNEIQETIKDIAESNSINEKQYQEIVSFLRKYTNENRPAASNRVIAAFLPNFVTTIVAHKYLQNVIDKLRKLLNDYPASTGDWLQDNINFINYGNSKVVYQDAWHSSLFAWYLKEYFEEEYHLKKEKEKDIQEYIDLLRSSKNLILTGAPGVGKTYTTAKIAVAICDGTDKFSANRSDLMKRYKELQNSGQIAFTIFHQSLDYEEFVEGLKPEVTEDNQVIYKVTAGIFKQICEKAKNGAKAIDDFDRAYKSLLNKISTSSEEILTLKTPKGKDFKVSINSKDNLNLLTGINFKQNGCLTKENIKNQFFNIINSFIGWEGYYQGVINELIQNHNLNTNQQTQENQNYVLIIDEINRGNISKIFGELITLLEKDKRLGEENEITVTLPYSQEKFGVPSNLYIIGTMNTADRSIGQIDYALRRRFAFFPLRADENLIPDQTAKDTFDKIKKLIEKRINPDLDADDIMIGHSYFMKDFENNLKYQIIPLLLEYNNDGLITLENDERILLKEGKIPEVNE